MSATDVIDMAPVSAAPRQAVAVMSTADRLLELAVQQGADLDKLERLMDLKARHDADVARVAYNVAFAAFKAEAVKIVRNRKVTDGPLKNKSYAELHAVVNAITPALSKHGLSMSWRLTKDDKDWMEVTCTLKHDAGHFDTVSMGGPPDTGGAKNAIQARASTLSYLERYTAKAITGLAEQDDDDDGKGGAPEGVGLVQILSGRAILCTSTDELRKVSREGGAAFKRDPESYRQFAAVVQSHGAKLRAQEGGAA